MISTVASKNTAPKNSPRNKNPPYITAYSCSISAASAVLRAFSAARCAAICSNPKYKQAVVDTVTSTMVERIQMLESPAAFCFIRYSIPDTAVKCRV